MACLGVQVHLCRHWHHPVQVQVGKLPLNLAHVKQQVNRGMVAAREVKVFLPSEHWDGDVTGLACGGMRVLNSPFAVENFRKG